MDIFLKERFGKQIPGKSIRNEFGIIKRFYPRKWSNRELLQSNNIKIISESMHFVRKYSFVSILDVNWEKNKKYS